MATNVEAKGGEMVVKSPEGHFAIIKPEDVTKMQEFIDNEKWDDANALINSYPSANDYAQGGELYIGNQIKAQDGLTVPPEEEPAPEIDYDKYLGETQFNTAEDLDRWNLQMQGKVAEGEWNLGQTPYQDLAKSQKFSDKYYGAGAKRFSDLIGEEAVTDLKNRRQSFLDEGVPAADITDRLSTYAIETYGDQYINKEDIYGDFGPRETSIIKEADTRLRSRRGLYGDATKAGTAGTLDVDDTKFGFRNYLNPQFIQNQQNYKDIWQPEETQQVTLQKRTNQNAKGGPIKAEEGLIVSNDEGDPPVKEKGILETASEYVETASEYVGSLFGSGTDKKAKQLKKVAKMEGPIRMDVSNYPEFGLVTPESIEDYYGSTVKEFYKEPGEEKGSVKEFQVNQLPDPFACTGSSCRAVKHRFPGLKNARDLLSGKYGFQSFTETDASTGAEDPGFDAWEIQQALRITGLGSDLFTSKTGTFKTKLSKEEKVSRANAIKNFDPNKISIGTLIGSGSASDQGYTKKAGQSYFKDKEGNKIELGESEQRSQHTRSVVGFDEETGDAFIYDYGDNIRVGDSPDADFTWADFIDQKEINYITNIEDNSAWTYSGLQQGKKQIEAEKNKKK